MINYSHQNNLVRNKIRIQDNHLEVMLDEENIMKTDLMFLLLFIPQQDTFKSVFKIYKTNAQGSSAIYAIIRDLNKQEQCSFHSFVMGGAMIDHINGDPLDNRLKNLRFTDYIHNNNNIKSSTKLENGVYYDEDDNLFHAKMSGSEKYAF